MSGSSHASPRDEFQELWSALPVSAPVTTDQVYRRATNLALRKRRRDVAIAVGLVLAVGQSVTAYVFLAWPLALWEWAGIAYLVTIAVGLLWISLAGRRRPSSTLEGTECVRVYRSLLERELDANRGHPLAFRTLFVFMLLVHTAIIAVKYAPATFWPIVVVALASSAVIWQRGNARALLFQTHIDALDKGQ